MDRDKLLRPEEAADILHCSRRTIYKRLQAGEIRHVRLPAIRIYESALWEYVNRHTVTGQSLAASATAPAKRPRGRTIRAERAAGVPSWHIPRRRELREEAQTDV